ncbi:hypothetical protein JYK14_00625 [Siccirubricoccus sp. KC 17139]|uniref:DUF2946 domain-containing protein n=1 Tax=Siccirubricoccus soli TaxID=2899147 RepID=A0ABT1CYE0_9PROT|nr:hypothetical protein [Siccirubricoccus soli]MCO6414684.1 hypothetical protein [Siccirubricoccus soli]MCP2680814.1 hypothetical protein [Siccirubricoccus soli]
MPWLLLTLALLLAPFGALRPVAAALLPICTAEGGVRLVPDPDAPAPPHAVHCDACLVAAPALPVPPILLAGPREARRAAPASPEWPMAPGEAPAGKARAPPGI